MTSDATREFYRQPGVMTSLGHGQQALLAGLPVDPASLRAVVPRLVVHPGWAAAYGVALDGDARTETEQNLRSASAVIDALVARRPEPLHVPRLPADRVVGTCRNFTVLYVALLRAAGIPARARCGHANYFEAGKWVDHWIAEWWHDSERHWVRADPQLDEFQLQVIGATWSADDLPTGAFLSGGEAWVAVRRGEIDPDTCGIFDMWGAWFVRSNAIRDLAALDKRELLPWDAWALMEDQSAVGSDADNAVIDEVAEVCASDDLERVRLMAADPRFAVPNTITSFRPTGAERVTL
jgi:hypothetical protein